MSCKLNNAFAAYVMIQTSIQCTVCHKKAKDKTQDIEPPPEDYGGFELSPNPAMVKYHLTRVTSPGVKYS